MSWIEVLKVLWMWTAVLMGFVGFLMSAFNKWEVKKE